MKKFNKYPLIFLFALTTINFNLHSQIPVDSLGKYSYPVIAFDSNVFGGGTCFFIKKYNSLYLISAKHVILGCDDFGNMEPNYPTLLLVGLYQNLEHSFTIDTKFQRGIIKCKGLDIYVQKINSSFSQYYNSVEAFIIPLITSPKTIEVFGFSPDVYRKDILAIPDGSSHSTIPEETFDFEPARDSLDKIDSLLWRIDCPKSVNVTHGFSGAPVFLQNKLNGNWRIIGILQGGTPTRLQSRRSLFYVDIKHVLGIIDKIH